MKKILKKAFPLTFVLLSIAFLAGSITNANAEEVILDNSSAGTSSTGTWQVSSGTGSYGANSLWSRSGATYTWNVTLPQSGVYEVYMWWSAYSSRSTSAPVTITYYGGSQTVNVNQRVNGSQWNLLGTYAFDAATGGTVKLSAPNPSPTSYCADAVRFVYLPGVNMPPTATIDSITPNPVTPGQTIAFTGHGTDLDGTITAYSWRSSIDGQLSTEASFSSSSLSEGAHTIYFKVQDNSGAWSSEISLGLTVGEPPVELILDNSSAGTSSTGTWQVSSGTGSYGANSLWSRSGATYTWNVALSKSGTYEVYMWWSAYSSRSTSAPVAITYSGGSQTVNVNQQINGSKWNLLGTYAFDAATGGTVKLSAPNPSPTSYCADAVRFVYLSGINVPPTATIDSISPNPATPGQTVSFSGHGDDSDGTVTGYNWRSSVDGDLSTEAAFSSSTLSEGAHTIYLKVKDNSDAWSTEVSQLMTVGNALPTATIDSITPNPASPGQTVAFTGHGADSDGTVTAYSWSSSIDGQLSAEASFSSSTLSEGTHTISFKVQDNNGGWSSEVNQQIVISNLLPTATIDSITPNPAKPGQAITFTGHGADSDGTVTGYNWRSSVDGDLSTESSFSSSTLTEGTHTIYFKVKDNNEAWSTETSQQIIVDNLLPTAIIDSITPNPATPGQDVNFIGHGADSDGTVTAYNWRSSLDGQLSDQASFNSTMLSSGTHTIFFKVQDNEGEWSPEASQQMVVGNIPTTEHIYICFGYSPYTMSSGVTSTLKSIGASQQNSTTWQYKNNPQNKTYIIHFVGSITAMRQALMTEGAHIIYEGHSNYGLGGLFAAYSEQKSQRITNLRYIDDDRIFNYSSKWIHVSINGLRTSQAFPYWWPIFKDGSSGMMPFDFSDPAKNPPYNYDITYQIPGDPTYYKVETVRNTAVQRFPDSGILPWYSPDGTQPDPLNPEHLQYFITNAAEWYPSIEMTGSWTEAYALTGYFKENYRLAPAGTGERKFKWIFRTPQPGNYKVYAYWPAAATNAIDAPYTINHGLGSNTVRLDQTINGSTWNELGEFYFDAGEYNVILDNSVSAGNVIADAIRVVHVDNPPKVIQSDFRASPTYGVAPLDVQFDIQITGDATGLEWDFGDGQKNTTRVDPLHTYTEPGSYTISLTVNGPEGTSQKTKVGYITVGSVEPVLKAEFSASGRSGSIPLTVSFRDRSVGSIVSWLWDFGDGQTSIEQSPKHIYETNGNYTVSLTITDAIGNTYTETKPNFVTVDILDKSIDNVDYPKKHYRQKNIIFRKDPEIAEQDLKYSRMFYLSCNSGNYFLDTFHRGKMFYTLNSANSDGVKFYLKDYLQGKSDNEIWQTLQNFEPVFDYYDFSKLPSEQP